MPQPSYEHCASDVPFLGTTIGRHLRKVATDFPGSEALVSVHQRSRFTYRRFDSMVDSWAKALMAVGVEAGDRVAIWSANNWEWVVSQYATARMGAVLVTVNPAYRLTEFEYVMRDSRSKVLLWGRPTDRLTT